MTFFKKLTLALFLSLTVLCAFGADTKPAPATADDLAAQKELIQLKLDAAKDLLQKDIQAKDKEVSNLKERIDKQDGRISDIGLYLTCFGYLIAVIGFLSVRAQIQKQVKDEAEKWFRDNATRLLEEIGKHRDLAEMASSDAVKSQNTAKAAADEATKLSQQHIDNSASTALTPSPALQTRNEELKNIPETKYDFNDWNTRAFAAFENGDFDKAAFFWTSAAESAKSTILKAQSLRNKGVAFGELNRNTEAIEAYDTLIKTYANDPQPALREHVAVAILNKGVMLGKLNRNEEAIEVYDTLIKTYANDPQPAVREITAKAMNNKGNTLRNMAKENWSNLSDRTQKLETALVLHKESLLRLSNNASNQANLAYVSWLLGKPDTAKESFTAALRGEGGGKAIYEATLEDLAIHPVPEDDGFRALIEQLWGKKA